MTEESSFSLPQFLRAGGATARQWPILTGWEGWRWIGRYESWETFVNNILHLEVRKTWEHGFSSPKSSILMSEVTSKAIGSLGGY